MPLFSVIIPLYNKQNYIAATLQSVLSQDFNDYEVLIINDCSTDNSLETAQEFNDKRFRILSHASNKGLSASRNTGIRAASGAYIAFLDADDTWKPGFLSAIHALIKQYPEAAVFATKYEEVYPGGRTLEHTFASGTGMVSNFFLENLNQSIYNYSCVCMAREVFDVAGLFDETITFGEDIDFNIRLHLSFKMAYADVALSRYTISSENQITQGNPSGKTIPDFDKYEKMYPHRPDLKIYLDFKRYVMAKRYKLCGDTRGFNLMLKGLDRTNLNWKQRLLLSSPAVALRVIPRIKQLLRKLGWNPTTY